MLDHRQSTSAVTKVAYITAKPGKAEALREALVQFEQLTQQEPGCFFFRFYQAVADGDQFVLLEHFLDENALHAHMQEEHTVSIMQAGLIASVRSVSVPLLG